MQSRKITRCRGSHHTGLPLVATETETGIGTGVGSGTVIAIGMDPSLSSGPIATPKRSSSDTGSVRSKTRGIPYTGAWLSYGFREDGVASGLRVVANAVPDVHLPFETNDPDREPKEVSTAWVVGWLK